MQCSILLACLAAACFDACPPAPEHFAGVATPAASQISDLPARELLPGDVVEIHTGDKVPADIRVVQLKTAVVRVEQAALTGESVAVAKSAAPAALAECELQVGRCCSAVPHTCCVSCCGGLC